MKNDHDNIDGLLNDMNDLYAQFGSTVFPCFRSLLKSKPGDIIADKNLDELIEIQQKTPSFDIGSRLLSTYRHQVEKSPSVHSSLQDWVLSGLKRIAAGEESKDVVGLKKQRGRATGSVTKSNLQIVAAYEYKIRQGIKPGKATEAVAQDLGITPKTISRARRELKIGNHIKTGLLAELTQFDYSQLLGQGH